MVSEVLKKVTILYVEDDDEIRPIVQRGISRRVKELFVAKNGLEGLEMYEEYRPDIVLTDIKMPKMNGIEMARKIKDQNPKVPIIIMSAHSESDFFLESIELGIDGYLLKPVDKDRMFEKLVHCAKDVLFEKNEKEHRLLIQELIDLQPSIIFSADEENKLLFVNKSFLNFFCCNTKIEDVEGETLSIDGFFDKFCDNSILENKIDGENWISYILANPDNNLNIKFNKDDGEYSFMVRSKSVNYSNGKQHIIMTLMNTNG